MKIYERHELPKVYVPGPMVMRRPDRRVSKDSGTQMIWDAVSFFGKGPICHAKKTDSATKAGTI